MTQEDKELLLKDLSARLPYGVIVNYKEDKYDFHKWKISTLHAPAYSRSGDLINTDSDGWIGYEEYKGCGMSSGSRPLHIETTLPFLRPMHSITEEEIKELSKIDMKRLIFSSRHLTWHLDGEIIDYLNKKMLDWRGLILRGLALEALKGMYK